MNQDWRRDRMIPAPTAPGLSTYTRYANSCTIEYIQLLVETHTFGATDVLSRTEKRGSRVKLPTPGDESSRDPA